MHCTLFRPSFVRTLTAGLVVGVALTSSGCKTGGWGSSSWSSPSWMAWGWGKKDAPSTAGIAATKPSTSMPSTTATPSPTTSIAAATPGSTASGATSTPAAYPTTPQAYTYPTQPAAAYQTAGAPGGVAPTGGYSVGGYSMTSGGAPAAQQSPYGQSYQGGGYAASPAPPNGQSWNTTPAYTADNRSSVYGAGETSPYSAPTAPAAYQNPAPGGYTPAGYNPGYSPSGNAPSSYGQPQSYQQDYRQPSPTGGYEGQHVSNVEATGYQAGSTNVAAPGVYGTASSVGVANDPYRPAMPAGLADGSGYRPGSTGRTVETGPVAGTTATGTVATGSSIYR